MQQPSGEGRQILLVEDDPTHALLMRERLRTLGGDIEVAGTRAAALEALGRHRFDVLVLDVELPDGSGFDVHAAVRDRRDAPAVVFVTSDDLAEHAVAAIRGGAYDYVVKRPKYLESMAAAVSRAIPAPRQRPPSRAIADSASSPSRILLGESSQIVAVRRSIDQYGPTSAPVLISGETGTGKELVARALHDASTVADGPFVATNCAAISPMLFESELFGSTRGAYTGAVRDRAGLVGAAAAGTLFLDETGDLPLAAQAKLLRLLEGGEYRPVGTARALRTGARVIAATNRDLRQAVLDGSFRADLYYRLNVLRIPIPPLRERRSDIPLLVDHFIAMSSQPERRPTPEAMLDLMTFPWPGNVRELRHTIERTLVQGGTGEIRHFDLETGAEGSPVAAEAIGITPFRLSESLARHSGRLAPVAREFGVSVRTIQRRMKDFGLERRDFERLPD